MSLSIASVKSTAKTSLKGNYFSSVVVCTIYLFAVIVCSVCFEMSASVIGSALSFLLFLLLLILFIAPLTLGVIYFTVRVIFGQSAQPIVIFKYFSSRRDFKRAAVLSFLLVGNALFAGILLFLPALFADLISDGRIFKLLGAQIPLWASGFSTVSAVLKVLAAITLIFVMLKYYLSPFLLVADENMDPFETLHTSKTVSSVTKKDFIWLMLSVLWYILACIFVIPNIFIFPYFAFCYCVHCRFCIASYNSTVDDINKKEIPSFEVTL